MGMTTTCLTVFLAMAWLTLYELIRSSWSDSELRCQNVEAAVRICSWLVTSE
jgi:hypothetical protein